MKKIISILLSMFLLTACGQGEAEQGFDLAAAEQETYIQLIDAAMEEYYWEYDRASLQFSSTVIPAEEETLFLAAEDCEYPLRSRAGQEAILAEAALLYYNGDAAGTLRCYLQDGQLLGVVYRGGYDNGWYSLKERNPFLLDGNFKAYEAWMGMPETFIAGRGEFSPEGIRSIGKDMNGNLLAVSMRDGRAEVYRYANGLSRYRNFSYGYGLEATSAVFLTGEDARLAVLISSITESGEGEGEKTYSRGEKVVLYDEWLNLTGEIPLEGELCTALGAENNRLYFFVDQNMDIYEPVEDGWARTASRKLKHAVTQFHITDLDGNGVKEYLMTDGMDLYLYRYNGGSFRRLWSTHLGVENFYGPIWSGDLNGDGVKEIYACDVTGTTMRYILTEKGLQTANEDIEYGQCIYPCDFNGDGKEDYWFVMDNIDRKGQLYLAEE